MVIPYEMTTSVRSCLSYDLSNAILSPSKIVYFKENKCIVVTEVVMTLLVPAKVIIYVWSLTIFMT